MRKKLYALVLVGVSTLIGVFMFAAAGQSYAKKENSNAFEFLGNLLSKESKKQILSSNPAAEGSPIPEGVKIQISEVYYRTAGDDLNEEFVEFYVWDDAGIANIDISGWYITTFDDDTGTLPAIANLEKYDYVAVYTGTGTDDLDADDGKASIYLNLGTEILDNTGDEVGLYDASGTLIDFMRYGGGNGDPVLGDWPVDDLGISAENNTKSIQIHGEDLNNSSNWVSAEPSPSEPNIYEFLMDTIDGQELWYQIHNGVSYPIELTEDGVEEGIPPPWRWHDEGGPLLNDEKTTLEGYLNHTYHYLHDGPSSPVIPGGGKELGSPYTGSDNDVDLFVTKTGGLRGRTYPNGNVHLDLLDENIGDSAEQFEKRVINKFVVEHEQVHLFQLELMGGFGPELSWGKIDGEADYWAAKIVMNNFRISFDEFQRIYEKYFRQNISSWLQNTDRNFWEYFPNPMFVRENPHYWYNANHLFLRWIEEIYGEEKVKRIFKVQNVSTGIVGMPKAVDEAFKQQLEHAGKSFYSVLPDFYLWLWRNYGANIGYVRDPTGLRDPLTFGPGVLERNFDLDETLMPNGVDFERIVLHETGYLKDHPMGVIFSHADFMAFEKYSITIIKVKDERFVEPGEDPIDVAGPFEIGNGVDETMWESFEITDPEGIYKEIIFIKIRLGSFIGDQFSPSSYVLSVGEIAEMKKVMGATGWQMVSLPSEPLNNNILIDRATGVVDTESIFYDAYVAGNDPRGRLFRYQPCEGYWPYNPSLYPAQAWYKIGETLPGGYPNAGAWWQGFWYYVETPHTITYDGFLYSGIDQPRLLDVSSCPGSKGWLMAGGSARPPEPYNSDVSTWPKIDISTEVVWGASDSVDTEPTTWLPTADCDEPDARDQGYIGLPLVGYSNSGLRYYSVSPPQGEPYCGAPANTKYQTPGEGYWLNVADPLWFKILPNP